MLRTLALSLLSLSLLASTPSSTPIPGFSEAASRGQREAEAKFDASLKKANLREWNRNLSARPHFVGAPFTKESAEWIASMFRSWGYDTAVERFDVLFPTPRDRKLELIAPESFTATLAEPAIEGDATSRLLDEHLPIYNAYSIDGDVTGDLVYVNYGVPKDYETLEELGIDVRGKIVIARYGGSWRGIKPKVAAEHGAIGCIIYSDPRDDGYFEGDVYPRGAFRPESGAQRGSVADMPLFPGDPLTPGIGANPDATRLERSAAPTLTKIPVLPISYGDALPLLRNLAGPVAPREWRGALPITYHLGPGPSRVHLAVAFDWNTAPVYDVIAKLSGTDFPNEWIIRGNHHDAWVFGSSDPVSGLVAMMEEARAIGELAKRGMRPRRTIVYAAWDAEEPGLLGSTEWVEAHAAELEAKAVAYINSDSNGRGFLGMSGSHTLEPFINDVARDVVDPQKRISVFDRARAARLVGADAKERREIRETRDLPIAALGSGSDYTPFFQHLGIASLNIGFGGENQGGSYHSIYDSFDHYSRFGDPNFEYGVALAQVGGRATLRLANADVLPFDFSAFARTVSRYADEVEALTETMRNENAERNRLIAEGSLDAAHDPTLAWKAPVTREEVPHLNFAPVKNAVARLQAATASYQKARANRGAIPPETETRLNALLRNAERALTRPEGLPRRSWFRHQVYAPGFYTGYGVKTLPGIREAIEQKNWSEAEEQIGVASAALDRFTTLVTEAETVIAQP